MYVTEKHIHSKIYIFRELKCPLITDYLYNGDCQYTAYANKYFKRKRENMNTYLLYLLKFGESGIGIYRYS